MIADKTIQTEEKARLTSSNWYSEQKKSKGTEKKKKKNLKTIQKSFLK